MLKRIINQSHTDRISLTWVSLYGRHEKVVNDISDRVYYIIDGEADFDVNGETGSVTGGDAVLIPKGVPYVFEGHMTYVVMNSPRLRAGLRPSGGVGGGGAKAPVSTVAVHS